MLPLLEVVPPMPLARTLCVSLLLTATLAGSAAASGGHLFTFLQERVPDGTLENVWSPGFGVGRTFVGATLPSTDPAFTNPSGDHTVAVLTNNDINLGGIAACAAESKCPDYYWSGWFFTGGGNTRRGLIVRADPTNQFQTFYQLVVNAGLFQLRFRKFVNGAPLPDLASWFLNTLPGGLPQVNTWHQMEISAQGNQFRCWFDGVEMTTAPIVDNDSPILTGWVGAYNFSASVGEVPVYFDDLLLEGDKPTPVRRTTWGELKQRFR
jgi:hypothetical protein